MLRLQTLLSSLSSPAVLLSCRRSRPTRKINCLLGVCDEGSQLPPLTAPCSGNVAQKAPSNAASGTQHAHSGIANQEPKDSGWRMQLHVFRKVTQGQCYATKIACLREEVISFLGCNDDVPCVEVIWRRYCQMTVGLEWKWRRESNIVSMVTVLW